MRTGVEGEKDGYFSGNQNDQNWKVSTKVGFLQAGAIHSDMINTDSLIADAGFINKLKVTNANIDGQLDANKIKVEDIKITNANIDGQLDANKIKVEDIKITNANISEQLEASKIKVEDIRITNANIDGYLDASKITTGTIDASKVSIKNLTIGEGVKIGSDFTINGSSLICNKYNAGNKIMSSTILDPDSIELVKYNYMAATIISPNKNPVTTTHHLQNDGLKLEYLPIGDASATFNCIYIDNAKDKNGEELSFSAYWGSQDRYKNTKTPIAVNAVSPSTGLSIETIGAIKGTRAHRIAIDSSAIGGNPITKISVEYSLYIIYLGTLTLNVSKILYNMEFKIYPCDKDTNFTINSFRTITIDGNLYSSSSSSSKSITLKKGKLYTLILDEFDNVHIF
jgi:hypothetical protein